MNIWRLIAHHENSEQAIEMMKRKSRIAIGWSKIGDMNKFMPNDASAITEKIAKEYPNSDNSHLGGPSLWNLYSNMKSGDQVIISAKGKRHCVFEIDGEYFFDKKNKIIEYSHQRAASLTSINPDELWSKCGANVAKGHNVRWTLALCLSSESSAKIVYEEGARFSVLSTAVERNPYARSKCIETHGCKCSACGFDFQRFYGDIGSGFIHVHHRIDLAERKDVHVVDPINDLIPLCANCHAMIHTEKPAMKLEKLISIIKSRENA